MDKRLEMEKLISEAADIHRLTCDPDTQLVWGEGDLDSDLVIVGEAPGGQEDRLGRPFVGPAGQLLNDELDVAGITRSNIYITNVVKCRPVALQEGRKSNRTPTVKEVKAWLDMLLRELAIISPAAIICCGAISASALIHPRFAMKMERGQWFDSPLGVPIMATFHPAYLLRVKEYGGMELQLFRQDLRSAIDKAYG